MRTHDDSPRLPARPSLLTQAQQAEADRNRILSTLEGGHAGASAKARRGSLALRGGVGALLLLLAAGVWLGQRGERVGDDDAPAAPVSPPVATAAVEAPPVVASIRDEAPPGAAAPQQSLSEMLDAGAAATAATGAARNAGAAHPGDVLSKALETPSPPAAASQPVTKQVAKAPRPAAKKPPAKGPAATPARRAEDSDIALLSALLAHAQAAPAPKKTVPNLRTQLQQCAALKRDAAAACRARACQGHAEYVQCKAGQVAVKGEK
ncbi:MULTISPECIES: hypothetical protein [unclassified Janthinobacterium]|uniref:hypothetical protein n=1 Tax=unclassified Janthinobacterium TaxID=2610881 RepID=UPI002713EA82|nr:MULTISPECIES: hypothetical protein [unclassified Janthinobacterium]MDO8067146.1 hypothetical protein [Janthinobacterium sp. SUN206]MDO8070401.1 hypothetical protein [Janthinobacterium sp. SUN176]